jgi:hypothetical protein
MSWGRGGEYEKQEEIKWENEKEKGKIRRK